MKLKTTIELTEDEVAYLKRFAESAYRPSLRIDWKCVGSAWAQHALKELIRSRIEEERKETA